MKIGISSGISNLGVPTPEIEKTESVNVSFIRRNGYHFLKSFYSNTDIKHPFQKLILDKIHEGQKFIIMNLLASQNWAGLPSFMILTLYN